jgi:hypothetical protein
VIPARYDALNGDRPDGVIEKSVKYAGNEEIDAGKYSGRAFI